MWIGNLCERFTGGNAYRIVIILADGVVFQSPQCLGSEGVTGVDRDDCRESAAGSLFYSIPTAPDFCCRGIRGAIQVPDIRGTIHIQVILVVQQLQDGGNGVGRGAIAEGQQGGLLHLPVVGG